MFELVCRTIFGFYFVTAIPLAAMLASLDDSPTTKLISGILISFWMLLLVAPRKYIDVQ